MVPTFALLLGRGVDGLPPLVPRLQVRPGHPRLNPAMEVPIRKGSKMLARTQTQAFSHLPDNAYLPCPKLSSACPPDTPLCCPPVGPSQMLTPALGAILNAFPTSLPFQWLLKSSRCDLLISQPCLFFSSPQALPCFSSHHHLSGSHPNPHLQSLSPDCLFQVHQHVPFPV